MPRRALLIPVLLLAVIAAPVRAADEAPANPFAGPAKQLRLGRTVRLRGAIVVSVQLPEPAQAGLDAKVGLSGAKTEILPLPGPAGVWHVRIANEGKRPLLVPTGDTLLTPLQASRSTDRPVWIAAGGATFVPVVQAVTPPPQGPYVCRGRGLTPFELTMIPPDRWGERVRARNRRYAVIGQRQDDAAAVYATDAFDTLRSEQGKQLDALVAAPTTVGVFLADDRGPFFAHIQTDRERFQQQWPALRDGILLDAAMVESVNGSPRPGDEGELRRILTQLMHALHVKPLNRPNFGEGWEYRWPLADPPGHWDGLATEDGPVCLRLYRYPVRPAGAPTPPGGGVEPPEVPDPGTFELERRVRPTEAERRLRERRDRQRNGGNTPSKPASPPSTGGSSKPGVPSPARPPSSGGGKGGQAPSAPSRPDLPGRR